MQHWGIPRPSAIESVVIPWPTPGLIGCLDNGLHRLKIFMLLITPVPWNFSHCALFFFNIKIEYGRVYKRIPFMKKKQS
jgi:hypothetical protein